MQPDTITCTCICRAELASRERRLRRHHRRRSADYAYDMRSAASWAAASDAGSDGGASSAVSMRDAFASLAGAASRGSFDLLLQRTMSSVGQMLHSPTSTMRRAGSMLFRDDFGIGLATSWLQQQAGRCGLHPAWRGGACAADHGRAECRHPRGGRRCAAPARCLGCGRLCQGHRTSFAHSAAACPSPACSLHDERLSEPGRVPIPPDAPSPSFLPMFPW